MAPIAYPNNPWGFYVQGNNINGSGKIEVDFARAKDDGASFVVIRASDAAQIQEGAFNDPRKYGDPSAHANLQKAYDNGLIPIFWHGLRSKPDTYSVDWKTPGAGLQYRSLAHMLKSSVQGVAIAMRHINDDTDGNHAEALRGFMTVLSIMGVDQPKVIAMSSKFWEYGSGSVGNIIGQPDFPHIVLVMDAIQGVPTPEEPEGRTKPPRPGSLAGNESIMWAHKYFLDYSTNGMASIRIVYLGNEGQLLERFGTPKHWDAAPVIVPPVDPPGPEDPPVIPDPITPPAASYDELISALDDICLELTEINANICEAWRLD